MTLNREIDPRTLQAALWWERLKETNNETFLPLFFDTHRYLVLMGGGGSGKSIFAGRKVLERCASEPGHRWLVCRKVARTLRESCFKQLCAQAYEFYADAVEQVNRGDMSIRFRNGSEVIFAGLDDVEKLKSIYNITGIWIEEASEILERDFNQLDIRLRGETKHYKQIIITFNPISIMHWLKRRFFDRVDERVMTHHSTYRDNRFLDAEAIRVLESYKDTDPYYYAVYCLGQWGVLGKSVFHAQAVQRRINDRVKPVAVGWFAYDYDGVRITNIRWEDDPDGYIRIYAQPEEGRPYVVGGDTAGEGSDWFVGQVLDNITGEQVAVLRHQFDEDIYARQMYCLGWYYNQALIGVEANYSTHPVRELTRLGYSRMYEREEMDTYTGRTKKAYGFQTTSASRPVIIAELIAVARERTELICDRSTLEEMLTFVRNEKLRPEAEAGAHDDLVMALAIAHHIRPQQRMTVLEHKAERRKKLIEQYRAKENWKRR